MFTNETVDIRSVIHSRVINRPVVDLVGDGSNSTVRPSDCVDGQRIISDDNDINNKIRIYI